MALTIGYSFTDRQFLGAVGGGFVGIANYVSTLTNELFLRSFGVTVYMGVISVAIPLVLGLVIALLLDGEGRTYRVLRAVFFVPIILSPVVVSTIWSSILGAQGILNTTLRSLNLDALALNWIGDPHLAPLSVAWVTAWQSLAFTVTVYLAGLQSVSGDLYEAAAIDGVRPWSRFRYITWPLIAPAFTINAVVSTISALKLYDQAVVLTNGGPGNATETVTMKIISTNFVSGLNGLSSAQAVILLAVIAVVSFVLLRWLQRRERDL